MAHILHFASVESSRFQRRHYGLSAQAVRLTRYSNLRFHLFSLSAASVSKHTSNGLPTSVLCFSEGQTVILLCLIGLGQMFFCCLTSPVPT